MGAQISLSNCDACELARYLGMFQVGAVASAGLHISLHLGKGPDEPKPAIAAPDLPVATYRLSGISFARVRERPTERRRSSAGSSPSGGFTGKQKRGNLNHARYTCRPLTRRVPSSINSSTTLPTSSATPSRTRSTAKSAATARGNASRMQPNWSSAT